MLEIFFIHYNLYRNYMDISKFCRVYILQDSTFGFMDGWSKRCI